MMLWMTCWFLMLPILSVLPVSMFCCWRVPLLSCVPRLYHSCVLCFQCMCCYSCGTESCRPTHTRLSEHTLLYVCLWHGLADFLSYRLGFHSCAYSVFSEDPFGSIWQPSHVKNDYKLVHRRFCKMCSFSLIVCLRCAIRDKVLGGDSVPPG